MLDFLAQCATKIPEIKGDAPHETLDPRRSNAARGRLRQ